MKNLSFLTLTLVLLSVQTTQAQQNTQDPKELNTNNKKMTLTIYSGYGISAPGGEITNNKTFTDAYVDFIQMFDLGANLEIKNGWGVLAELNVNIYDLGGYHEAQSRLQEYYLANPNWDIENRQISGFGKSSSTAEKSAIPFINVGASKQMMWERSGVYLALKFGFAPAQKASGNWTAQNGTVFDGNSGMNFHLETQDGFRGNTYTEETGSWKIGLAFNHQYFFSAKNRFGLYTGVELRTAQNGIQLTEEIEDDLYPENSGVRVVKEQRGFRDAVLKAGLVYRFAK